MKKALTLSVLFSSAMIVLGIGQAQAQERAPERDDTLQRPMAHPQYPIEVEPHVLGGFAPRYGASGLGAGLRLSVPVADQGLLPKVNDTVAVTFGADFLQSVGCSEGRCDANYLLMPVAAQWNFYTARKWSLFGEPGMF